MGKFGVAECAPVGAVDMMVYEGTRRTTTLWPHRRRRSFQQGLPTPVRRLRVLLLVAAATAAAATAATAVYQICSNGGGSHVSPFFAIAYTPVPHRISSARTTRHSLIATGAEWQRRRRTGPDPPWRTMGPRGGRSAPLHRSTASSSSSSSAPGPNANELFPLQRGSSVALVTPFHQDSGSVDLASLDRLLEHHLSAGTNNLCILGTTGEASLLSMSERETILKRVVEQVKGRMCILVGTGTINPTEIRAMTQQAIDVGCDASLVVTPYYVKPPQRGLVQHMVSCADMGLPVCMYNVPGRTGVNMLDESLALAAELHEGIVAIKDATGDLRRLHQLRELTKSSRPDLLLYSGDDATSLDFVLQGGDGCISVTANVAASEMAIMMRLSLQQRVEEARTIDNRLEGLHSNLFLESNPIPVKWAVHRLGLIGSPYCRPPLATFDEATLGVQLEESIYKAGLLQ